jgi:hypothetical protein
MMAVPTGMESDSDKVLERLKNTSGKTPEDVQHDELVAKVIEYYRKSSCTIYVAKSKGKGKVGVQTPPTCDLIITCKSETCKDGFVVLIEVKGASGLDTGVSQLAKGGAKAALDAGVIPKKPDKNSLDKCYHSIILVQSGKTLKEAGKLKDAQNGTPIGEDAKLDDQGNHVGLWIQPTSTNDVDKLPKP